ncbi:SDR family oxidoreductase [Paludibacterium purpuratum]|uniref:NAD(P)-dependent dehydrogenase (Short-subunit alcohol dehydrogenase family) n=1 Tax=Paludibacterium purpuratum TaxID=1144873 RepID=A0A4R7BCN9_9NEIS|nr:SDR family oxidoreductase [Paludibacterium purpuratum]TDR81922.1 NAD(P)-dependent dehydrogenase (short-subunit alcohol dehydrogenase family) [Paludibacterium purpuratum]
MDKLAWLDGQHVLVLGGSHGIGRAVALAARAAGARVTVVGRSAEASDGMAAVGADLTDWDALPAAFAGLATVDHVVSTIGSRVAATRLEDLSYDVALDAYQVKVLGNMAALRAVLPHLAPRASITLTSGLLSRKFAAGNLLKGSINAAVETMGQQLARELAPRRVNVVSPGVIDTPSWGVAGSAERQAMVDRIGASLPVGRVGTAEELAATYLHIMGNGFLTGAVLDVNGGGLV